MKTYKELISQDINKNTIDEGLIFGIAIERKLKATLKAVQATDDIGRKLDLLMKGLHFSLGGMAYELHKSKKY